MGNKVIEYFENNKLPLQAIFTGEDTSTVEKAAQVLGTQPAQIAKTLAMHTPEGPVVVVATGTARIDNRKFKEAFNCKAKMLSPEETQAATGFPVGGVCPFALPATVQVYLDESLKRYEVVYPAAGTRDSAVRVEVINLPAYTGGKWVDVCKQPD